MLRKFFLIAFLIPLSVIGQELKKENTNIDKWLHCVVNIEARYNNKGGGAGTAVFLYYKNKLFLLTARHVIKDPTSEDTNQIAPMIILVENFSERDVKDTFYADRKTYTFVGDTHFLIFGTSSLARHLYFFSSLNNDLALIDLNKEIQGRSFANLLFKRGYRPISINDIDTVWNVSPNQSLFAIGFPQESEVAANKTSPLLEFKSRAITIPIVSQGITNGLYNDTYFDAYLSIYHGFSGGPIVSNNKLIGIVHGMELPINKTSNFDQIPYYMSFHLLLIKSSLIMKLIKKSESFQ